MTWSYFFHRRYSMSWQRSSILITEHALNRQPVPLIAASSHSNLCVSVKNLLKSTPATLPQEKYFFRSKTKYHDTTCQQSPFLTYKVFSLKLPASMQIYWDKRKRLHKKRVQLPEDWSGTPTWLPLHCFRTPILPPWCHVKTLYSRRLCMNRVRSLLSMCGKLLGV